MPLSAVELFGLFQNVDAYIEKKATDEKAKLEPTLDSKFMYSSTDILGKAYGYLYKWIYWITGSHDYRNSLFRGAMLYASYSSVKLVDFYWSKYCAYSEQLQNRLKGVVYNNEVFSEARWQLSRYDTTLRHTFKRIQKYPENYRDLFLSAFSEPLSESDYVNFAEKGAIAKFPYMPSWFERAFQWIYAIFRSLGSKFDARIGRQWLTPALEWLTTPGITKEEQIARAVKAREYQFKRDDKVESMEDLLPIIRLEIASEMDFPLDEFVKIFKDQKRTEAEEQRLTEWCNKIEKWGHYNAAGILHECLSALHTALINLKEEVVPLESVEYRIYFNSRDKKQTKWEEEALTNPLLNCGEHTYTIEQQFATIEDNKYFSLAGSDKCLRIPPNTSLFAFEKMALKDIPLEVLKVSYENKDGKYSIVEAPKANLIDIKWKSTDEVFHKDDLPVIKSVGRLVSYFFNLDSIPVAINPHQFCVLQDNEVKAWQVLLMRKFDFHIMVEFLKAVSQNNSAVYKRLMEEAGLENHKFSRFYLDLLEAYLEKDTFEYDTYQTKYGIAEELINREFLEKVRKAWAEIRQKCGNDARALAEAKESFIKTYLDSKLIFDLA